MRNQLAAGAVLLLAVRVEAIPLTWAFDGQFNTANGGCCAGSFDGRVTFNNTTGQIGDFRIRIADAGAPVAVLTDGNSSVGGQATIRNTPFDQPGPIFVGEGHWFLLVLSNGSDMSGRHPAGVWLPGDNVSVVLTTEQFDGQIRACDPGTCGSSEILSAHAPEPASWALLLTGLLALPAWSRWKGRCE